MTMPSSPTDAAMFPPAPSSMYTVPATLVTLICTLLKSWSCATATLARTAATIIPARLPRIFILDSRYRLARSLHIVEIAGAELLEGRALGESCILVKSGPLLQQLIP